MGNETDELSHALQQMQENLKRISDEHSERLMLQTGRNTLNQKLQGDKSLPELSKDIIDFLLSYSIAQVGSLYVFEEGALHLQYACGIKGQAKASFQIGEGLIGQAAAEKSLKVFDKIPKAYFKILSSIGEEKPDAIAVVPSCFDNKIISVIELARFGGFSNLQLKLLEEISEPVAIAINSLLVKRDMENLITQLNTKEQELNSRIGAINKSNASIEFDLDGTILKANEIFLNLFGYTANEVIGKHHSIFVEKGVETSKEYREFWNNLKNGEYQQGEFKRIAKNGEARWIQGNYNPILDLSNRPLRILKIANDITATKKQQIEIDAITMAIYKSNAVVEFDLNGVILNANDIFLGIFRYTKEEIVGKHHRIFVDPSYGSSKEYGEFWSDLKKGEYQQGEFARITKDGESVWIKGNYNPIFDTAGQPYKILKIATNVTQARKQAQQLAAQTEELATQQEELRQSNEELLEKTTLLENSEAELKTQQEELQQTNEELEEKANLLEEQRQILEDAKTEIEKKVSELAATSKYKSEFLANMSHELRTPLNSILLLSQLLKENKNKVLQEKEIQFATNIYNSGADLLNLIDEILDLSKVEAGKMELDIHEFQIDELVEDIERMFIEIAKNKSIAFEASAVKTLGQHKLISDKQRIGQILRNLLSNAFKFTSKGGSVKLFIDKPGHPVSFKRRELNNSRDIIAFSVTDTGIGIPREKLGIIFEAFQQVDGSTKRKYGGTGLGLSISRELAQTLGGEIQIESEEGKGSTFTLYLPSSFDPSTIVSDPQQISITEKSQRPTSGRTKIERVHTDNDFQDDRNNITGNNRVILIIEDDPAFAGVLLDFVRERNYKGIVACQGNTGLNYARLFKPDAIMLDMKLPVMDGTEVLKQLKSDPHLRHIPVQIISGFDSKNEGLQLGAFDFIRKPVEKEILRKAFDKIEDFLSRKVKRLLVVEDDKKHNEAVKELIGNGNVKCSSAYSGSEAYELLRTNSFDCMILDLGLPDMTGFDLLEKIKGSQEFSKVPVIVYTGKDLTKDEHNKLQKLASTVVLKTADSHERLLDETILFLHCVESKLPPEKQNIIRKLHKTGEIFKNKRVLVVDDDIRNVYSLTNVLEEEGLHCLTAENGKDALEIIKHHDPFDLILMDVMMPEMDGYEATREIRKIDKFKKLPIIALTAKAMKGDREKCLAAGMSDYITKPLNVEQLLSLMRVWLYK